MSVLAKGYEPIRRNETALIVMREVENGPWIERKDHAALVERLRMAEISLSVFDDAGTSEYWERYPTCVDAELTRLSVPTSEG